MMFQSDDKLSNSDIRDSLLELDCPVLKIEDAEKKRAYIDSIVQMFWKFDVYNSVIAIPRYFESLKKFLRQRSKGKTEFTRSEYYDFLINDLTQATPEDLQGLRLVAFEFESRLTGSMSEIELVPIWQRAGFGETINPDELPCPSILAPEKSDDGSTKIGFIHHSVQEYLATQHLLHTDDPLETFKKATVFSDQHLTAFKGSWINVLRFLLESDIKHSVLQWFVGFKQEHPDDIDDRTAEYLTDVDTADVSTDMKASIFGLVYGHYQDERLWLPFWASEDLGKFIQYDQLESVTRYLTDPQSTADFPAPAYVRLGNAIAVIGSVLKHQMPFVTAEIRKSWRDLLVAAATQPSENGVVQRRALRALENYDDPSIIAAVATAFNAADSFASEAFLSLCTKLAPNSAQTIDYISRAVVQNNMGIEGRHALYAINNKDGIQHFMQKLIDSDGEFKENFLELFLEQDSIFNDRKNKADDTLLDQIDEYASDDTTIVELAEDVIWKAIVELWVYGAQRSYFITRLTEIVEYHRQGYLFRLLERITKDVSENRRARARHDFIFIFAKLIRKQDVDQLFKWFREHDQGEEWVARQVVKTARSVQEEAKGEEIYQYALEKGYVEEEPQESAPSTKEETLKRFQIFLEPEPGKYVPSVFAYYLENYEILEVDGRITAKQRKRLKKLVVDEGLRFKPRNFEVTLDHPQGSERRHTITQVASYYGDVLRVAQKLVEKGEFKSDFLSQYRQDVIDFIPFAYSEDQRTIREIVAEMKDEDLVFVNAAMMGEQGKDARYFLTSEYVYTIRHYLDKECKLTSVGSVMQSLASDEKVELYARQKALEAYSLSADHCDESTKAFLLELDRMKESDNDEERLIGIQANGILISAFTDDAAIEWRLTRLRQDVKPFTPSPADGRFRRVLPLEDEFSELHFAKPLIERSTEIDYERFMSLLEAVPSLNRQKEFVAYSNYLIEIVMRAAQSRVQLGDYKPVRMLSDWYQRSFSDRAAMGVESRIEQLRSLYVVGRSMESDYMGDSRNAPC